MAEGFSSRYGARPLRRAVQRWVEDTLAECMLDGFVSGGQSVELDVQEGHQVKVRYTHELPHAVPSHACCPERPFALPNGSITEPRDSPNVEPHASPPQTAFPSAIKRGSGRKNPLLKRCPESTRERCEGPLWYIHAGSCVCSAQLPFRCYRLSQTDLTQKGARWTSPLLLVAIVSTRLLLSTSLLLPPDSHSRRTTSRLNDRADERRANDNGMEQNGWHPYR